jgi:hypothetical protein
MLTLFLCANLCGPPIAGSDRMVIIPLLLSYFRHTVCCLSVCYLLLTCPCICPQVEAFFSLFSLVPVVLVGVVLMRISRADVAQVGVDFKQMSALLTATVTWTLPLLSSPLPRRLSLNATIICMIACI